MKTYFKILFVCICFVVGSMMISYIPVLPEIFHFLFMMLSLSAMMIAVIMIILIFFGFIVKADQEYKKTKYWWY